MPACLICTVTLISLIILINYEKREMLILIAPLLIAISYVDARDQEIPDFPVAFMLFAGFMYREGFSLIPAFVFGIICLPFVLSGKLGMGDLKLMGVMMAVNSLAASAGFIIAALLCLIVHKMKKESSETKIPFAPYLCTGYLTMLVFLI